MEYLTVKEVAELKGCSEQYIKRQAKNGILSAELTVNPATNKTRYMIPLTALPEQLQEKWYKKQRTAAGVLPESSEPEPEKPKVEPAKPQRTFEELTEQERQEITVWAEILREWQGLRSTYKGSMKEFDKLYIGKCQLEHPNIKVSESILYRKWAAYRSNDMEGLLDGRGGWNRGASQIPAPIWDAFLYWWLDERKPTVSLCYRNVISWTEEFHPELVHLIPQERAFRRRIDRDVADYIQIMMRDGQKAFDDRCAPYIMRLYDQLEANDCWVADTHTLDIQSTKDGTKHRLYLTAFLDIKSGDLQAEQIFGLKVVSWFGENGAKGLPALFGTSLLFDRRTGEPRALLNAGPITGLRTGAAAAVGAKTLARPESESLLMVGCGHQSPYLIAATLYAMPGLTAEL